MRIVGIDPGLEVTGYAVLDSADGDVSIVDAGIIKTNRRWELAKRLVVLSKELAELLGTDAGITSHFTPLDGDYVVPEGTDVLVNGTSIGLFNSEGRVPVEASSLGKGLIVADVVFSPPVTQLLREAKERGCTTLGGLTMLVNQARICFKLWTNVEADADVIRESLEEFLGL